MVDAPTALVSYCAECDALPGDCSHTGARYLESVVYERLDDERGQRTGWKVPDGAERERWDAGEKVQAAYRGKPPAQAPTAEAKPLQRLVVELEAWIDLDPPLESKLRAAYEAQPLRVSRIVDTATRKVQAGELYNAAGYLAVRLRELE